MEVMDEVRSRREPVLVTKKGVPVVNLVPTDEPPEQAGGGAGTVMESLS